jgi:hypothetical protein
MSTSGVQQTIVDPIGRGCKRYATGARRDREDLTREDPADRAEACSVSRGKDVDKSVSGR